MNRHSPLLTSQMRAVRSSLAVTASVPSELKWRRSLPSCAAQLRHARRPLPFPDTQVPVSTLLQIDSAVWAEDGLIDGFPVTPQFGQAEPCRGVPHARRMVLARRHHISVIRTERGGGDSILVARSTTSFDESRRSHTRAVPSQLAVTTSFPSELSVAVVNRSP